jgi:hypothetical protein
MFNKGTEKDEKEQKYREQKISEMIKLFFGIRRIEMTKLQRR